MENYPEKNNNKNEKLQENGNDFENFPRQAKKSLYFVLGVIFIIALVFTAKKIIFTPGGAPGPESAQNKKTILEESGSMKESSSSYWWLNSGGVMEISNDSFSPNKGELSANSRWQKLYAKSNPKDTDNGAHPQNIFRLVTRQKWQNFSQSVYFNIDKINLSGSDNRNESNGVLLFNRYQDGDNLYYTGFRVDGHAVIKKKIGGKYYTLDEKDILADGKDYDRNKSPNFLPLHAWIGLKSEVTNTSENTVDVKLFMDNSQKGNWQLVLETQDENGAYGKAPFTGAGYAGIRTDFMDVDFRNYKIEEIRK